MDVNNQRSALETFEEIHGHLMRTKNAIATLKNYGSDDEAESVEWVLMQYFRED